MTLLLIVTFFALWGLMLFIFIRNRKTFRFSQAILNRIGFCADVEILRGEPWKWRYEEHDKGPSYNKMLFSFKPLDIKRPEIWYSNINFLDVKEKP